MEGSIHIAVPGKNSTEHAVMGQFDGSTVERICRERVSNLARRSGAVITFHPVYEKAYHSSKLMGSEKDESILFQA